MLKVPLSLPTFTFSDHACRFCGGRILNGSKKTSKFKEIGISVSNQSFTCANCERECSGKLDPKEICYCGSDLNNSKYVCFPIGGNLSTSITQAVLDSGFNINSGLRIGFINLELFQTAKKKDSLKKSLSSLTSVKINLKSTKNN